MIVQVAVQLGWVVVFAARGQTASSLIVITTAFTVSCSQFSIATRDAYDNTLNRCYVENQKYFTSGTGASQFIIGGGSSRTTLNDCVSYNDIEDLTIDLYDADNAPYTTFNNCKAIYGDSTEGAGFWAEGDEQDFVIQRNGCIVVGGTLGFCTSQGAYATDVNCKTYGCSLHPVWDRNGGMSTTGCEHYDGGDLLYEEGGRNTNMKVGLIDGTEESSIKVYNADGFKDDTMIMFTDCTFDRIYYYSGGADEVQLKGCVFRELQTYNTGDHTVRIIGGKVTEQLELGRARIRATDVTFVSNGGAEVVVGNMDTNDVILRNCSFHDLTALAYSGDFDRLIIEDSDYIDCSDTDTYDTNEVYLSDTAVDLPGCNNNGTYLVCITKRGQTNYYGGTIMAIGKQRAGITTYSSNTILQQDGYGGWTIDIDWSTTDSRPQVSLSTSSGTYDGVYKVEVMGNANKYTQD